MSEHIAFLIIEKRVRSNLSFNNLLTKFQVDFLAFLVDFINEIMTLIEVKINFVIY